MGRPESWRVLLGSVIHNAQERQRIANELGVSPVTLTRWVNDTASPRIQNLQRLLDILPERRDLLLELVQEEFPDFSVATYANTQDYSLEIPSGFYKRVLYAFATTPKVQRFWVISNLILQQALGQLDPNRLGLALTVVQCMPPSDNGKVQSLRERVGQGTPPWPHNLEQSAIFLGAESLAGHVVTNFRPYIIQNRTEHQGMFPAHWVEGEKSAAAYPIILVDKIAGCLLLSSTQPNFFLSFRCTLIEDYVTFLILLFEPEEFYLSTEINLRTMPFYRTQEEYLTSFSKRVSMVMKQAAANHLSINLIDAQNIVWRQFGEEFLQLPPYLGE